MTSVKERSNYIGGSDIPALFGFYKTPYQLWNEKMSNRISDYDNQEMFWGRRLEGIILAEYCRRTNTKRIRRNAEVKHPQYPFLLGHLDALTHDNRVIEIKTSGSDRGWGGSEGENIPPAYKLQVQFYMLITGAEYADVAALLHGNDFRIYTLQKDISLQNKILDASLEFWKCIENKTPPQFQTYDDVCLHYRDFSQVKNATVRATGTVTGNVLELKELQGNIKTMLERETYLKQSICNYIGFNDTLVTDNNTVIATWKTCNGRKRFNLETFKTENPDLHEKYLIDGEGYRRLCVK